MLSEFFLQVFLAAQALSIDVIYLYLKEIYAKSHFLPEILFVILSKTQYFK